MITIFAPAGIGEVSPGTDLAPVLLAAIDADPAGPLRDGDILVVTSKIISKAEGRIEPASRRAELITSESTRTIARRGETRIVRTENGLDDRCCGDRQLQPRCRIDPALAARPGRQCSGYSASGWPRRPDSAWE